MTADANQTNPPKDLIGFLDYYLVKKAPFQIPDAGKEFIVKYGPWIVAVLLALSLPALFVILGLSTAMLPYGAVGYGAIWGIAFCLHLVLMGLALPGLFARKMSGWTLLFYAQVVSVVASLLSYAILSGLIVGLISFYVLFQVRAKYS